MNYSDIFKSSLNKLKIEGRYRQFNEIERKAGKHPSAFWISDSKKNDIMADIVINHSSARGLWFKNFLKEKKPGKDYFLTVNSKFNVSKVIRPRD